MRVLFETEDVDQFHNLQHATTRRRCVLHGRFIHDAKRVAHQ